MSLYDRDFYGWAQQQAALLRAGRRDAIDLEHIAEEIESLGKSEKRELVNRLTVLLLHLLKWRFQPERRGSGWEATIRVQRLDLTDHLADNPSLKPHIAEAIAAAYLRAAITAAGETGLARSTFPADCPWTVAEIMDAEFWPAAGDA